MRLFQNRDKKEWDQFLRSSSVEQLEEERHRLDDEIQTLRQKKLDIQHEVDVRHKEWVATQDQGQVLQG